MKKTLNVKEVTSEDLVVGDQVYRYDPNTHPLSTQFVVAAISIEDDCIDMTLVGPNNGNFMADDDGTYPFLLAVKWYKLID